MQTQFRVEGCRDRVVIKDYIDLVLNVIKPTYFVSPTEHLMKHTGRKKGIKASLQSVSNVK